MLAQNRERRHQHRSQCRTEAHDGRKHHAEHRHSLAYITLDKLTQHPHRLAHLSTILQLLKLDDSSWDCIKHLRNDKATALLLRTTWPQLYQIPEDLMQQIYVLRLDDHWERLKHLYLKALAGTSNLWCSSANREICQAGLISPGHPTASLASGSSSDTRVSTSTDTNATMSWASSDTCLSGNLLIVPDVGEPPFVNLDQEQRPEVAPMPPPKAKAKKHYCPLQGCDMSYRHKGHFDNHMRLAHGYLHTTSEQRRPQPRVGRSTSTVSRANSETPVPITMMAVQHTLCSAFSDMHSVNTPTSKSWINYQRPPVYGHTNSTASDPSEISLTNAHLDTFVTNMQQEPSDFDMPMTDPDYQGSSLAIRSLGEAVEDMAVFDATTTHHGELLYREFRAEDMSRSYSQN